MKWVVGVWAASSGPSGLSLHGPCVALDHAPGSADRLDLRCVTAGWLVWSVAAAPGPRGAAGCGCPGQRREGWFVGPMAERLGSGSKAVGAGWLGF